MGVAPKHPRRMLDHVVAEAQYSRKPYGLVCQCGERMEETDRERLPRAFMNHRSAVRGVVPSRETGQPRRVHRKQNHTFVTKPDITNS